MACCSSVVRALILLTVSLHLSSAGTHSYKHVFTGVTPGIHFPEFIAVGMLDEVQINYYDSNNQTFIRKVEWIKDAHADDVWESYTEKMKREQRNFKLEVATLMQHFNHTEGIHTWQWMVGCECDDDGPTGGFYQFGYDGEDFISLDLKTKSWTAANPQAEIFKRMWESDDSYNNKVEHYVNFKCIDWLKEYVRYSDKTLENKVRPEVSVFQNHSSSPEVVCHATGFFPKAVTISWQKDGEDVYEDVELRETLPNQDGSFQKRSILKVPAEELQKHTYTCVIQHSSLEKDVVLSVSERRILRGGGRIAIIVVVVMALTAAVARILYLDFCQELW